MIFYNMDPCPYLNYNDLISLGIRLTDAVNCQAVGRRDGVGLSASQSEGELDGVRVYPSSVKSGIVELVPTPFALL